MLSKAIMGERGALLFFGAASEGGSDCVQCHSGDAFTDELFAVREGLQDETAPSLLPNEKPGLETQRRFHRRRVGSGSSIDKTIIRAQNELSFRKMQLKKAGSPDSDDLIVASLREEISQLRTSR